MKAEQIQRAAYELLCELKSSRLEVAKIKGLRKCVTVNADWYCRFCDANKRRLRRYPRPRTVIKRWWTIEILERLVRGEGRLDTVYGQRILPFIEERIR